MSPEIPSPEINLHMYRGIKQNGINTEPNIKTLVRQFECLSKVIQAHDRGDLDFDINENELLSHTLDLITLHGMIIDATGLMNSTNENDAALTDVRDKLEDVLDKIDKLII